MAWDGAIRCYIALKCYLGRKDYRHSASRKYLVVYCLRGMFVGLGVIGDKRQKERRPSDQRHEAMSIASVACKVADGPICGYFVAPIAVRWVGRLRHQVVSTKHHPGLCACSQDFSSHTLRVPSIVQPSPSCFGISGFLGSGGHLIRVSLKLSQ